MHFGFCLPNNQGVDDPADLVELAVLAEDLGYDSVWTSEHLFHASYVEKRLGDRPYHEPLTVLAAVAVRTTRVRLGTSVLVLPWHHPVRLAKTVATLDVLARGRVTLGVGVGAAPDEYAALGVPFAERGALADEMLDAMRALWTEERPHFDGAHYRFSGLPFSPKPAQEPHLPLWIGGSSRAALRRVVRAGDGWHPLSLSPADLASRLELLRRELEAAGRDTGLPVTVAVRVMLDLRDEPWERPIDQRRSCRGTPAEITAMVRAYSDAGATHLVLDAYTRDMARTRELMQWFQQEVRPSCR
jgi:probable F420-dependent oxidoreductase